MNILFVTQYYYPAFEAGGPVVKIRALAERLMRRGHFVSVLTAAQNGSTRWVPSQKDMPSLGPSGPRVVRLWTALSYRMTTVNPTVWLAAKREVLYADVIHLFGFYDLLAPVVAREARQRRVPYVCEPMGMFVPILRSLAKKRVYHHVFGRSLVDGASCIVATSSLEREELIRSGLPREKVVERRNGIDLSEFSTLPPRGRLRTRLGIAPCEKVILYLGRLTPKKNPDLLLRAFARQNRANLRLIIAGPAEPGYREKLVRLANTLRLGRRVIFTGPLFEQEKLAAFVDADLFVLPSINENFGNAVAEAVAVGTPVVITDRCGIAPFIRDRAGLVVVPDESAVARAMERMLTDAQLYRSCKEACPSVAQQLSWDEPVREMEALYARIAGQEEKRPMVSPWKPRRRPRRILLVTQYYMPSQKYGGPVFAIKGLAENLVAHGHRVTVLTASEKLWARAHRVRMNGVEVIYLKSIARYRAVTLNPGAWSFCRDLIPGFDVIHIFGLYDILGPVAAYHAARAGRPYVVETLGMAVPLVRSLYRKHAYNFLVGRRVLKGAFRIVATSRHEFEQILQAGLAGPERIVLRWNGLDLSEFQVVPPQDSLWKRHGLESFKKILFLGRIAPVKGVELLIRAFAKMGTESARLMIVGPDDGRGYKKSLQRLARDLGIADRVNFPGPVYGKERIALLKDADVLVLPSVYESFGIVAAEAVAAGTPVVVTKNCGIAPIVRNRVGLVTDHTAEGIASAIQHVLSDPEFQRLFREQRSAVAQEFSWDKPVARMNEVYEEMITAASGMGTGD